MHIYIYILNNKIIILTNTITPLYDVSIPIKLSYDPCRDDFLLHVFSTMLQQIRH